MSQRDDFAEKVKAVISARVGYRCSNPECRAQTSGPHTDPKKQVNIGVAAHIAAAAVGGPRYDALQSTADRSSHMNAIWLCQTCSKLIDSDVARFTIDTLKTWKRKAESFAETNLGKAASNHDKKEPGSIYMSGSASQRLATCLQTGIRTLTVNMPPSRRLVANYECVEFQEEIRTAELAILDSFCREDEQSFDVLIIVGSAGSGKTRLMLEWCKRLRQSNWIAGFLEGEFDFDVSQIKEHCLVVMDYAETRTDEVLATLNRVKLSPYDGNIIKIVLLARGTGPWLEQIRVEAPWFDDMMTARPIHVMTPLTPTSAQRFYDSCVHAFGNNSTEPLRLSVAAPIHPLYVQMLSLTPSESGPSEAGHVLLGDILNHERRFWWQMARSLDYKVSDKLRRHVEVIVWLTSLCQTVMTQAASRSIVKTLMQDFDERHFKNAVEVVSGTYSVSASIRPDILAEHIVVHGVESFRKAPMITAISELVVKVPEPASVFVMLERTMSSSKRLCDACRQVLQDRLPGVLEKRGVARAVANIISSLGDNDFVEKLDFGRFADLPVLRVAITGIRFKDSKTRKILTRDTVSYALDHSEELQFSGERSRLLNALQDSVEIVQRELIYGTRLVPDLGYGAATNLSGPSGTSIWRPPHDLSALPDPVSVFRNSETLAHLANLLIAQARTINEIYTDRVDEAGRLLEEAREHIINARLPPKQRDLLTSDWYHARALLHMRAERWTDAQTDIERVHALRRHPRGVHHCQSLLNLAICHFNQGKREQALLLLQQADLALGDGPFPRERAKILYNQAVFELSDGSTGSRSRASLSLTTCAKIRRELCEETPSEGHLFELARVLQSILRLSQRSFEAKAVDADMISEYVSVCEKIAAFHTDGTYSEFLVEALLESAKATSDPDSSSDSCERAAKIVRAAIASGRDLYDFYHPVVSAACDVNLKKRLEHEPTVVEMLWLAKNLGDTIGLAPEHKFVHALTHNDLCAELRFAGDALSAARVAEDGLRLYADLEEKGILEKNPALKTERLRMLGNAGASLLVVGRSSDAISKFIELATRASELLPNQELTNVAERAVHAASEYSVIDDLRKNSFWTDLEARLKSPPPPTSPDESEPADEG